MKPVFMQGVETSSRSAATCWEFLNTLLGPVAGQKQIHCEVM